MTRKKQQECCDMPEWARKLEDWGRKMEDWGKKFDMDSRVKPENDKKYGGKKKPWERKGEFLGNIFGNIIGIFVVVYAQKFFPNFFSESYPAVLSVMVTVAVITMVANLFLVVFSPKWFFYLTQSMLHALSVVSMITIITIFPFQMSIEIAQLVRFGLSISTIIVGIIAFVYLVKFLFALCGGLLGETR